MTLAFTVFGVAQPKGNMRPFMVRNKTTGMKIPILTETNRNVKSWSQLVAQGANEALGKLPESDRALLLFAVRLTIAFYLPRPQKHSKRGVFVPHCVSPDVDKLSRAVLDALTHVVYQDDKQVTELIVAKYYADIDEPARVKICVEAAPGPPPMALPHDRDQPLLFEATV